MSLYNGVPKYQDEKDRCVNGFNEDSIEFNDEDCRRHIKHSNWEEDQPIVVHGKANGIADRETRVVALRLYTPNNSFTDKDELHVWKDITLPDINV